MSLSNSNKPNSNALPLRLISQKKGKLVITPSFHNQIKYLCSKINTVEWSGILYHTAEGDLENPESFVCKPQHILLMDKGTSGYTEYDFSSPLFMEGLHDKPELMDMTPGHIHSHHSMDSFFSQTDSDELAENAVNYNYYLSLIVNNRGKYVARVAFPGKIEGRTISYTNNKGLQINIKTEDEDVIFYYEMDIVIEEETFVDKIKRKFLKKYNRAIGTLPEDAVEVLNIVGNYVSNKESENFDVEKCFEDQYNRVVASKPTFSYNNYGEGFTFGQNYHQNNNVNNKSKKEKFDKKYSQGTLFSKKDDEALILRFAAIHYIKCLCESAYLGIEYFELSTDLKTNLTDFLSERNGWLATRGFEKDVLEIINDDVQFSRFCERFLEYILMDDIYDYSDFDIAKINEEAVNILEESGFKNYALSKLLVKNLSAWVWE